MGNGFSRAEWDAYAEYYDSLNALRPYAQMLEDVVREIQFAAGPMLDAGCGTGNLIERLGGNLPNSGAVGIDSSDAMLSRAQVKCPNVRFLQGDLDSSLPFYNTEFSTITCVNALYAVKDPEATLLEFHRLLRSPGLLVLVTPKFGYENGLILKAHCNSNKPDQYWEKMHADLDREEQLVREAITDPTLADSFLRVAQFNRVISKDRLFHFFKETELANLVENCGFVDIATKPTYAKQNILLVANRT